jgi:hypothetical protein
MRSLLNASSEYNYERRSPLPPEAQKAVRAKRPDGFHDSAHEDNFHGSLLLGIVSGRIKVLEVILDNLPILRRHLA